MSEKESRDKFAAFGLSTFAGSLIDAPLLEGCIAWLECRVLPEPSNQQRHDLFIGEVIAAQADSRVFRNGRCDSGTADNPLRTIHHVAGAAVDAKALATVTAPPARSAP